MLPIIEDSNLDLSDLGLEEVFMANNEPKVEEEDDVLRPKKPHLHHHQSFLQHPLFQNIKQE